MQFLKSVFLSILNMKGNVFKVLPWTLILFSNTKI